MKEPTNCILWKKPELIAPSAERFEPIASYADGSHWSRCLLKCRECGQLYFYEFYESIDWDGGDDPQYSTYIPVETEAEIDALKGEPPLGLLKFFPRLQKDFPKGAKGPRIHWARKPQGADETD
jgi:hypothetical protein